MGRPNRKTRKPIPQYRILVDGETEIWYFQRMVAHEGIGRKV